MTIKGNNFVRDIVDTLFHASVHCAHIWVSGHTLPTIWKGYLKAYNMSLGKLNLGICSLVAWLRNLGIARVLFPLGQCLV
jgi:hypothetical protein